MGRPEQKAHPHLNGPYEIDPETTSYGRATYKRCDGERGMVHYKREGKGGLWAVSFSFGEEPCVRRGGGGGVCSRVCSMG